MAIRSLKIIILVENTAGRADVLGEHGFACWLDADGRHVLLDTGQGRALAPNCATLGVDVSRAEAVVLSHGHDDHTGVLPRGSKPPGTLAATSGRTLRRRSATTCRTIRRSWRTPSKGGRACRLCRLGNRQHHLDHVAQLRPDRPVVGVIGSPPRPAPSSVAVDGR